MDKIQEPIHQNWTAIIDNHFSSIDIVGLKKSLNEFFIEEYKRISIEFPSDYFKKTKSTDEFINEIPEKLEKLKLLIRPFKDKSYSCIITDEEVDLLANLEHYKWVDRMLSDGWQHEEALDAEAKIHPDLTHFTMLDKGKQRFYRELIYTIPVIMKRCGFEIFKPADQVFIKTDLIENISRAIHERYRIMMREMDEKSREDSVYEKTYIVNADNRQYFSLNYDQLPEDIKSSNIDSAYHIATKLLAIGYTIRKIESNTDQGLLFLGNTQIETMAKLEHERWAWEKRIRGFTYGEIRNDSLKKHPCLVPYNELPELEKDKDRVQVKFYPTLIHDINYTFENLSPEQLQNISYIPRQRVLLQDSLADIENTIIAINAKDIKIKLEKKSNFNNKLSEALSNIKSAIESQDAASQIQQCIMPTKLFFKTCLPDSFILHKPKDILSGDFYFISKNHNFIICAAADCTGHGPAGAMLSMICSNFIDQAVNDNNLTDPSMIISFIYKKLVSFMKRYKNDTISDYGMEIAICTIIPESRIVFYSGVNRPLYYFKNKVLEIIEPQKVRIGCGYESITDCINPSQQINLSQGDTLYMFSDGYVDQMGGVENRKFQTRNFKELLQKIQHKPMLEQFEALNSSIEQWMGYDNEHRAEQTDDILVIGVKV